MFKECEAGVIVEVIKALKSSTFLPGDYVTVIDSIGSEMYFIRRGRCAVLIPKKSSAPKRRSSTVVTPNSQRRTPRGGATAQSRSLSRKSRASLTPHRRSRRSVSSGRSRGTDRDAAGVSTARSDRSGGGGSDRADTVASGVTAMTGLTGFEKQLPALRNQRRRSILLEQQRRAGVRHGPAWQRARAPSQTAAAAAAGYVVA